MAESHTNDGAYFLPSRSAVVAATTTHPHSDRDVEAGRIAKKGARYNDSVTLLIGSETFDYSLDLLRDLVPVLDAHIAKLEHNLREEESDFWTEELEAAREHAIGLGLVACQTYITDVTGALDFKKSQTLSLPPLHPSGSSLASAVNAAANRWKHEGEWDAGVEDKRRDDVLAIFDAMGVHRATDFPLAAMMRSMNTPNLAAVVDRLTEWRDNVIQVDRTERPRSAS
jgi:hypothetical protein